MSGLKPIAVFWLRRSGSSGGSVRRRFSRHDSRVQRDWCLSMDAGGLGKPEETRSSSAEVPLDKGDLGRHRLPAKAVRPWCQRSSADFGGFRFTKDDFSSNHGTRETCLEKPRSWGRRTLPSDEPVLFAKIADGFDQDGDSRPPLIALITRLFEKLVQQLCSLDSILSHDLIEFSKRVIIVSGVRKNIRSHRNDT